MPSSEEKFHKLCIKHIDKSSQLHYNKTSQIYSSTNIPKKNKLNKTIYIYQHILTQESNLSAIMHIITQICKKNTKSIQNLSQSKVPNE